VTQSPRGVDATVPHAPRIWNYWLGGKDNFAADREVGDRMAQMYPDRARRPRNSCASGTNPSSP